MENFMLTLMGDTILLVLLKEVFQQSHEMLPCIKTSGVHAQREEWNDNI
jgi:hypothetical protein